MNVCIDGLAISNLQGTGLHTYSNELLNHLFEAFPQPQYHLIYESDSQVSKLQKKNKLIYMDIGLDRKGNDYTKLENYLANNNINLFHSPNNGFSIPDKKVCKYIMTVHDLSPLTHRDFVDEKYFHKFNKVFPNAIEKSDVIIATSQFLRNELVKKIKASEKKIEVIYPGCSNIFIPIPVQKCETILENKYGIKGDFILFAGSIHPRKNLDKLIHVFSRVLKFRDDLKLVIAGKINDKRESHYLFLKDLTRKLMIEEAVLFPGIVEYEDMPLLYNKTLCALNLSDYEGYPTATVEAIACNTPIICSDFPPFQEVAGTSGILVDPKDVDLIHEVLMGVVSNTNYKKPVLKKVEKQREDCTWESAIKKIVHLYESTV